MYGTNNIKFMWGLHLKWTDTHTVFDKEMLTYSSSEFKWWTKCRHVMGHLLVAECINISSLKELSAQTESSSIYMVKRIRMKVL